MGETYYKVKFQGGTNPGGIPVCPLCFNSRTCTSHTALIYLPPELDVQLVLLPEDPRVRLCVQGSHRRMMTDLLRYNTIVSFLVDELVRLTQERVERLAVSVEIRKWS